MDAPILMAHKAYFEGRISGAASSMVLTGERYVEGWRLLQENPLKKP
jgi:hypothetical protein